LSAVWLESITIRFSLNPNKNTNPKLLQSFRLRILRENGSFKLKTKTAPSLQLTNDDLILLYVSKH